MKLPSLQHLVAAGVRVARRFPLTLLCSLILCADLVYQIWLPYSERVQHAWILPLLSAALLGLTLTLVVDLAAARYHWRAGSRLGVQAGALVLLGLWYALRPAELDISWIIRLILLLTGLHLLVASVLFLTTLRQGADTPGFWRYNEVLFLRILTAGLYSGVLYVGCALALLAIENLFDVKLDHNWYGYLFVVLATIFNTWFFLAGIPSDFAEPDQEAPYPKALKLFTQFVLLPLVVLYLGILYAYLGRILALWELPKGWVSTLVLALAVAGIFALLLIHPIRDAAENTWIRTFARWFYRALFPLLMLLAVAISRRISEYGITEERYFVLVLAAWLAVMATYFLIRQGRGIVWIPVSLAGLAFLAAGGPWGAVAVAERSQVGQLRKLAEQYNLLQNGKLDGAGRRVPKLPLQASKRITSIFEFFAERQSVAQLQPFFTASLQVPDSILSKNRQRQNRWNNNILFTASKLPRVSRYDTGEEDAKQEIAFQPANRKVTKLAPSRYWVHGVNVYPYDDTTQLLNAFTLAEGTFRLRLDARGKALFLDQQRADKKWQLLITIPVAALADSLVRQHSAQLHDTSTNDTPSAIIDVANLMLLGQTSTVRLQVVFESLERVQAKARPTEYHFRSNVFLVFNLPE